MELNPNFEFENHIDLTPLDFINEAHQLIRQGNKITPHVEILQQLIEQFEQLDFEGLANPHNFENFKLNTKHYRILSIKNVSKTATQNHWGLCKNHDFIYLYNGTFWAEIDKDEFQKFLGEASEKMGVRWDNAQDYQFREQLFKQFLATEYLSNPHGDQSKVLINLINGTFEISPQGTNLRPFDRSDFLTLSITI